ncbi:hypothetical protein BTVI_44327 [Pitangus sulphuratus]|nr:hypothetical protein BTVI_44327 [Pitangus sulphuratus]
MPDHPFHEEIPPDVQPEPLLAQFEAISSCPVTGCLVEEDNPHLSTTSFQKAKVGGERAGLEDPPRRIELSALLKLIGRDNIFGMHIVNGDK